MNDADERHKRQTGPEVLVSISVHVVAVKGPDQGSTIINLILLLLQLYLKVIKKLKLVI